MALSGVALGGEARSEFLLGHQMLPQIAAGAGWQDVLDRAGAAAFQR